MLTINKRKYNKKFFRKYGYKVTEYPIETEKTVQEEKDHEDAYERATYGNKLDASIMEGYVEKYPDNPRFKSHLYTFYNINGEYIKAQKIAIRTLNQHPDYLFGRLNMADTYIKDGNHDMANKMLGEPRKIETILPDREIYHISEFLSYHSLSGAYALGIDDRDTAEEHLVIMIDLNPEHHITKSLALYMMDRAINDVTERADKAKATSITPDNFPTYKPEQTEVPPKLNHQELEAFYLYSEQELPKEIMDDILKLPPKTLIADLENILDDSIRRYKYYYETYAEFNESEQSFPIHALRFLGALEAHESIQSVLNLLRQGEEFLEYWFADRLHEYVNDTLLIMGKHQLEALKAYTLESHQFCPVRICAFEAITQVALHDPDRHDEVVQICKDFFDYHLQHAKDKTITSTELISWAICDATDLRDESMTEYIDTFDEKKWLIGFITGSAENLKKDNLSPPEPADINPIPLNIHEFYSREHLKRKPKRTDVKDIMSKNSKKVADYLAKITIDAMMVEALEESGMLDMMDEIGDDVYYDEDDDYLYLGNSERPRIHEYQEPVVREEPKVGRNAPCPCGSGKKYKRCHLKKAK